MLIRIDAFDYISCSISNIIAINFSTEALSRKMDQNGV